MDKRIDKIPKLPLDIQEFDRIRGDDFIYVDKTGYIARLINSNWTYFFLSRPRRFGKSLLVSTMKEIFSGNKELFKNLQVYDKIDWQTYPVIHFDFTLPAPDEETPLKKALADEVDKIARQHDLPVTEGNHKAKFRYLIENLSKKENKPVVILIDEYDYFIIHHITDEEAKEKNRADLKDFFSILKGSQKYLRFVFITGISRFTRVSIFSDLNNLIDLTFNSEYAAIAGYTEDELLRHFRPYIQTFAQKENCGFDQVLALIKKWYNGYSWDGETRIYNPFSILKLFLDYRFDNYWYASGTPTFLLDLIRERKTDIRELDDFRVSRSKVENLEESRFSIIPLLFQTGYLTIAEIIKIGIDREEFLVDYPNLDVRKSFLTHLLENFNRENPRLIDRIAGAVNDNRIEDALNGIKSVFSSIPYNNFDAGKEASYHSLMHIIFMLLLDHIGGQQQTNRGRIDEVIETSKHTYIFEFKMDDSQKALAQIHEKKYYEKFLVKNKPITLIGVSFSKEERNIRDWVIEPLGLKPAP